MVDGQNIQKRAVCYYRQSSGADDVSLSIDDQKARCRAWAERNNVAILEEFEEYNTSGELYPNTVESRAFCITDRAWQSWRKSRAFKKHYRDQLGQLFEFIKENKIDFVIDHERTRLYRSPNNCFLDGYIIAEFKDRGIFIVDVSINKIDELSNSVDIATQRLLATYEQSKIDEKAEQSKRARRMKKERGFIYSNAFAIEYNDKKISFDGEKAKAVKYIFESMLQGKTYAEILYILNTTYLHLAIGKCFYESSIYNIIKNPVYCGYFEYDGEYKNIQNLASQPIITFTDYREANELVANRKHRSGKQKYNVKGKTHRHFLPFSGLLICGNCGKRLSMIDDKGLVYFCKNTILTKNKGCTSSRIRMFSFYDDNDFLLTFQALFSIVLSEFIWKMGQDNSLKAECETLKVDIENAKSKLKQITDLFMSGDYDGSIFVEKSKGYTEKIKAESNKLFSLENQLKDTDDGKLKYYNEIREKITYTESVLNDDLYSLLLRKTIKKIIVYSDHLTVELIDSETVKAMDNSTTFDIPRITLKHRRKILPISYVQYIVKYSDEQKSCCRSYPIIIFDCNDDRRISKHETILRETEYYKIILKY